ncbi:hypothetical protein GCM10009853_069990 [Glycomyces scopariae]
MRSPPRRRKVYCASDLGSVTCWLAFSGGAGRMGSAGAVVYGSSVHCTLTPAPVRSGDGKRGVGFDSLREGSGSRGVNPQVRGAVGAPAAGTAGLRRIGYDVIIESK